MFLYIISIRSFEGNFHWSHPGVSPQWRKMFCLKKLKDKTQKHFDVFSTISVTGLGVFLKVLGNKISCKRSPNEWHILGYFEKHHAYVNTALATLWPTFGQHWATFYSNIWSHCLLHTRADKDGIDVDGPKSFVHESSSGCTVPKFFTRKF